LSVLHRRKGVAVGEVATAVMSGPWSHAGLMYSLSNNEAPFNWYCPLMLVEKVIGAEGALEDSEGSSHRKSPNGNSESR
jgi:hypothetical protein